MGRPLVRSALLRKKVYCYLAQSEKAVLENKAQAAGLPLSCFIREAALGKNISPLPILHAKRWAELAPLQSNLNQLLRHLNQGVPATIETGLIEALYTEVRALRADLLEVGE